MSDNKDAMSFVADWIAHQYDNELGPSCMYSDLHNAFRTKCGRNALGLRNALQHYVKLGDVEVSKGSNFTSQMYSIAGAVKESAPAQSEVLVLQTDDNVRSVQPVSDPSASSSELPKYHLHFKKNNHLN